MPVVDLSLHIGLGSEHNRGFNTRLDIRSLCDQSESPFGALPVARGISQKKALSFCRMFRRWYSIEARP